MRSFVRLTKALADENRVRILMALREGELCVCRIIALLKLAPSTVSQQLSLLYNAHLIEKRKEGRWAFYRLSGPKNPPDVSAALTWVQKSLQASEVIKKDRLALKKILLLSREEVCKPTKPSRPCKPR